MLVLEDWSDRKAEDRHGDDAGDHAAEAERRALEEHVAREGLAPLRRRHGRLAAVGRDRRRSFGRRLRADDADREADRPKAGRRKVRFLLARLGLHLERLPSPAHLVGFNRLDAALVNDVTTAATALPRKVLHTFRGAP